MFFKWETRLKLTNVCNDRSSLGYSYGTLSASGICRLLDLELINIFDQAHRVYKYSCITTYVSINRGMRQLCHVAFSAPHMTVSNTVKERGKFLNGQSIEICLILSPDRICQYLNLSTQSLDPTVRHLCLMINF